jgi:hypothetical protein
VGVVVIGITIIVTNQLLSLLLLLYEVNNDPGPSVDSPYGRKDNMDRQTQNALE